MIQFVLTCRSAIQAAVYTEYIKRDEEKIQTGAVVVNLTKDSVVRSAVKMIEMMWLRNELPQGDSRCRDRPPTQEIIAEAVDKMRTTFGADIHFAQNDSSWSFVT